MCQSKRLPGRAQEAGDGRTGLGDPNLRPCSRRCSPTPQTLRRMQPVAGPANEREA
jgi:hypothetical protein